MYEPALCEELENRLLLSTIFAAPLPDLAAMDNPENIVVRFETNVTSAAGFSHFDIELFVADAGDPVGTVDNFLTYIRDGQYDGVFFHRSQSLSGNPDEPPEIIQGGRNRFDDATGQVVTNTSRDPIDDEIGRDNTERTIAMAKTGAPNSASSQFFINLIDNTDVLSPANQNNGGFPVFGRIVDDVSWDVIQTIAGLNIEDLRSVISDPQFGGGAFGSVPVTSSFDPNDAIAAEDFVTIIDAEVIKPQGMATFFDQSVFLSEGYRNFRSDETLTVVNTNSKSVEYQAILRYATGFDRDLVVDFGTLEAGERAEIKLSGSGASDRVIGFIPYAVEVNTASDDPNTVPVSATLTRSDFADQTSGLEPFAGEALFNPLSIADADRRSDLQTWTFADGERDDANIENFITWMNLTDEPGEVTIKFFFEDREPTELVTPRALGSFRRGGVDLKGIGASVLPEGAFSAQVTSTVPIVASMSTFRLDSTDTTNTGAALTIGLAGQAGPIGALADARRPADGSGKVSVVNLGAMQAVVRFDFVDVNGNRRDSVFNRIDAGRRQTFELDNIPGTAIATDSPLSVRLSVQAGGPAIAAQFISASSQGGGGEVVLSSAATSYVFADARSSSDTGFSEVISVYNPGSTSLSYTFAVHFDDGTVISVSRTVAAKGRSGLDVTNDAFTDLQAIQDKIASAARFESFAVQITGDAPLLASLTRIDDAAGRRFTTLGTMVGDLSPLPN